MAASVQSIPAVSTGRRRQKEKPAQPEDRGSVIGVRPAIFAILNR